MRRPFSWAAPTRPGRRRTCFPTTISTAPSRSSTRGARLVSLHRNRWWQTSRGPLLDSGAFVAGLEYAAGVEAEVVGKPSLAYFEAALAELGAGPGEAVMVGDDIDADIGGGQAAGLRTVLLRTGKFREETLAAADAKPDVVLDSIADVPAFLRESA